MGGRRMDVENTGRENEAENKEENRSQEADSKEKKQNTKKPMERMSKIRRNWKLTVQVGLIISVIFLVVIVVTALILVRGSISTYLESKEEYMRPLATRQQINLDNTEGLGWFFDFWEDNPSVADNYVTAENMDEYYQLMLEYCPIPEDSTIPMYDAKKLDEYPKQVQYTLASYLYTDIYLEQLLSFVLMENLTSLEVDVQEDRWGTAILLMGDRYQEDQDEIDFDTHLGEDFSEMLNDLKGVQKVIKSGIPVFERYDSPKDGNYYYIYISPIVDDMTGKIRALQLLIYDWSDFHSQVLKKVLWIAGISALVLTLAAVLLLFFINRSAIRPLAKVQKSVRGYMEDKDSLKVYERLKNINQRNEFGALAVDVTQMAAEIDRYTEEVTNLTRERERVEAELSLAADIQQGFLPGEFPDEKDYELYASMNPAKEVGGDLYDFFDIDPTHVGLVIGDVSGKGVPASLFMMIAKVLIREYARTGASPAEVLSKANQTLCMNNKNDMFVTAWFGILDRSTGKVVAASAGHEFPILHHTGDQFELIKDRHGFVLGGMEMSRYREYELELGKGGTLFVYTDGAPEATNAEQQLFGTDRMLEALNSRSCEHPREVIDTMDQAIARFVGNAPQFDDLTMLCVKYNGQE